MTGDTDLAEAIRKLKEQFGSDDKLAAELGTSRQIVISWRKGRATPSKKFEQQLTALGISPELFRTPVSPEDIRRRLNAAQAEIDEIRRQLGES